MAKTTNLCLCFLDFGHTPLTSSTMSPYLHKTGKIWILFDFTNIKELSTLEETTATAMMMMDKAQLL